MTVGDDVPTRSSVHGYFCGFAIVLLRTVVPLNRAETTTCHYLALQPASR